MTVTNVGTAPAQVGTGSFALRDQQGRTFSMADLAGPMGSRGALAALGHLHDHPAEPERRERVRVRRGARRLGLRAGPEPVGAGRIRRAPSTAVLRAIPPLRCFSDGNPAAPPAPRGGRGCFRGAGVLPGPRLPVPAPRPPVPRGPTAPRGARGGPRQSPSAASGRDRYGKPGGPLGPSAARACRATIMHVRFLTSSAETQGARLVRLGTRSDHRITKGPHYMWRTRIKALGLAACALLITAPAAFAADPTPASLTISGGSLTISTPARHLAD